MDRRAVRDRANAAALRGDKVGVCMPVVAELWYGVENSATRKRNAQRLRSALRELVIWPFDIASAEEYGRLAAHLRRVGRPMQQIDIMIAAVALSLGNTTVVSSDSDFAVVPNLTVENWATS